MEDFIDEKSLGTILGNQLLMQMKRKDLNYLALAKTIKKYIEIKRKEGLTTNDIEREIGIGKKELYRIRSLLQLSDKDLSELGKRISLDKLSRITYNLKDGANLKEIVEKAVQRHLDSSHIEHLVSEANNPAKITEHIMSTLYKFQKEIELLRERASRIPNADYEKISKKVEEIINTLSSFRMVVAEVKVK